MKSRVLLYALVLAGSLCACQKEDPVVPNGMSNPFATLPGATDEETKLREDFYEATGCHLLFNDTLRHEYKGLDGNGNPYYETELLGLEYSITNVGFTRFKFDYLQTLEQKRAVTDFLLNDLLPYIRNVMPYSMLVANGIDEYQQNSIEGHYEYVGSPLTYNNLRCLALNLNRLGDLAEGEMKEYAQDICCEMIFASFGGSSDKKYMDGKAGAFFQLGSNYYGYPKVGFDWETFEPIYHEPLKLGFLEDDPEATNFPSPKDDAVNYIKACLSMTEEEFFAKYGQNDINGLTRQKYDVMKPLLDATGIKFN